jgi:alpha-tubulin suppressor-like RCC1 family protein
MKRALFTLLAALGIALLATGPAAAEPHGNAPSPRSATTASAPTPAPEATLTGITQVNAGYYLTCARTNTGQARCWGENDDGQLGNGNVNPHTFAVTVRNGSNTGPLRGVVQVAAGDDHACALLTNHQVRCWGDNSDGQVGNGTNGNTYALPRPVRNATNTGNLVNVIQISAESDGTCALLSNHQLRCWGDNDYGQLGNGQNGDAHDSDLPVTVKNVAGTGPLTNVTQVESGYDTNCARLSNGQARCWGYNEEGQLGNDENGVSAEDLPVVVLNVPGTGPLTTVTQISASGYEMCARLSNGQARCWGYNDYGSVGDGTTTERDRPVPVRNAAGTGPLQNVVSIYAGYSHSCALITNGQVRCWGETYYGEVGDGTPIAQSTPYVNRLRPRAVRSGNGNLTGVVQIHANQYHTCAVLNTGQVRCWGYNGEGQLGNGGTTDRPVAVKVRV